MILLPAIDLYEKKVVRLEKGDYRKMTVYSSDPLKTAKEIEALGAGWLHMVDLEGAENGGIPNFQTVCEICSQTGLSVEIGGGIRSMAVIEAYMKAGASRVILGTKAVTDRDFLKEAVDRFGEKIAVGVDLKDGRIAIRGWKEVAELPADTFFEELCRMKVGTLICTDISKDGMLGGANLKLYEELSERYPIRFIASGGVSSLEDLVRLKSMGLYGAILGKAMYTGAVDLRQALEVCREEKP